MKKALIFTVLISLSIFSKEISIDDIVNIYLNESVNSQIDEIEIEKANIEETWTKLNRYRKVDTQLNFDHGTQVYKMNPLNYEETQSSGAIEARLGYRFLYTSFRTSYKDDNYRYSNGSLVYNETDAELDNFKLGVRKTLNDLLYSQEEYDERKAELNKEIVKGSISYNKIEKINELIEDYTKIQDTCLERNIKETELEENTKILNLLKKQFSLGEVIEMDVEYAEMKVMELKNDIEYLEESILTLSKNLFEKIGGKFDEANTLEALEERQIKEISVNSELIRKNEYEKLLENEDLKYIKRKKQGEITTDLAYDFENESWELSFDFVGDFFEVSIDEKQKKLDINKKDLEEESIEIDIENKRKLLEIEFSRLKKDIVLRKKTYETRHKHFNMIKKMYMKGYTDLKEFLEYKSDEKQALYDYERAVNNYNGFCTKMYYTKLFSE